jgi:hypothetical protein
VEICGWIVDIFLCGLSHRADAKSGKVGTALR